MRTGWTVLWSLPPIRLLMISSTVYNSYGSILNALQIFYMTKNLGLKPGIIGLIVGIGSTGSVLGGLVANSLGERTGLARGYALGVGIVSIGGLLFPMAHGSGITSVALLTLVYFLLRLGGSCSQVFSWSIRQSLIPAAQFGSINSVFRFFINGVAPLSAVAGGYLAELLGVRQTLIIGAIGLLLTAGFSFRLRIPKGNICAAEWGESRNAG